MNIESGSGENKFWTRHQSDGESDPILTDVKDWTEFHYQQASKRERKIWNQQVRSYQSIITLASRHSVGNIPPKINQLFQKLPKAPNTTTSRQIYAFGFGLALGVTSEQCYSVFAVFEAKYGCDLAVTDGSEQAEPMIDDTSSLYVRIPQTFPIINQPIAARFALITFSSVTAAIKARQFLHANIVDSSLIQSIVQFGQDKCEGDSASNAQDDVITAKRRKISNGQAIIYNTDTDTNTEATMQQVLRCLPKTICFIELANTELASKLFPFELGAIDLKHVVSTHPSSASSSLSPEFIDFVSSEQRRRIDSKSNGAPEIGLSLDDEPDNQLKGNSAQGTNLYHGPRDVKVVRNVINKEEEKDLLSFFAKQDWIKYKRRHVLHYGHAFDYSTNNVKLSASSCGSSFPSILQPLVSRLQQSITDTVPRRCSDQARQYQYVKEPFSPDQLTVNRYFPGHGIPPHVDTHSPFTAVIVSISLGADTVMELSNRPPNIVPRFSAKQSKAAPSLSSSPPSSPSSSPSSSPPSSSSSSSLSSSSSSSSSLISETCLTSQQRQSKDSQHSETEPRYYQQEVVLPRRSMLVMSGDLRYCWTHGIASRKMDRVEGQMRKRSGERISLTFRRLTALTLCPELLTDNHDDLTAIQAEHICNCNFPKWCDSQDLPII